MGPLQHITMQSRVWSEKRSDSENHEIYKFYRKQKIGKGISTIKMNFIYLNYFVITSCSKMLQKYAISFIHKEFKILFCPFESGRSASKLVHFFSVKTLAKQPPL